MPSHLSVQERRVIENCLRNLRSLEGCQADYVEQDPAQEYGRLRLKGPWGDLTYLVLTRMRLSSSCTALTISQLKGLGTDEPPLLVADYIPETIGSELRQNRVDFIDTAGNALLCRPPLYIEVSGRKRSYHPPKPGRAFQSSGLKLIYLLLRKPEAIRWTYRELANQADIALGAIGPTLQELCELNYLDDLSDPNRQLSGMVDLLARWEFGYGERLRPKLLRQTCRLEDGMTVATLIEVIRRGNFGSKILIGGEAGAHLLLQTGTPQTASLHISGDPLKTLLRLNLVPDPRGQVSVLSQFSVANCWQGRHPEGLALADPLLQHAEIGLSSALDASLAEQLFKQHLEAMLAGTSSESTGLAGRGS